LRGWRIHWQPSFDCAQDKPFGRLRASLVKRLKKEGYWVRGVDLKYPGFSSTQADDFIIGDWRDRWICRYAVDQSFDKV